MKKIYFPVIAFLFFFCLASSLVSCKKNGFLAQTVTTNLSEKAIFTDSVNTYAFLSNIYSNIKFAVSASRFTYPQPSNPTNLIPCGGLDAACDESEVSHAYATTALAFANGSINALNVTDDVYKTCYQNIRACNQLIKNIHLTPINSTYLKTSMVGEAQFLRAWYYSILLQHYGGVAIVGDNTYDYNQDIPVVRNTFQETVKYITSQCDSAYKKLPITQQAIYFGRADQGACLALKARVLLYSASPLYNVSGGLYPGNALVCNVGADSTAYRWKYAKDAAYALLSTGRYSLYVDNTPEPGRGFEEVFTMRQNTEGIFQFMTVDGIGNTDLENLFNPPSRTGKNGAFPYQELVDAFPMSNGMDIKANGSGYDTLHPYKNRDPRLKHTVLYTGSLIGNRTVNGEIIGYSPVDISLHLGANGDLVGGQDAVHQGTVTGYYNNKMVDTAAISEGFAASSHRCIPLMSYPEMLLSYAEAKNEADGPVDSVYIILAAIRNRAGIVAGANNLYGLKAGMSQTEMRAAIQNERRLELAYEGHRFFDVRRWKIAGDVNNQSGQKTGMEVDSLSKTNVKYVRFNVRNHAFRDAMYFWPFPQNEVYKSQPLIKVLPYGGKTKVANVLIQNPGY